MHPAVSRSSCLGSPQAVHVLRPTSDLLLQGVPPGTGRFREPRAPEWCWALSTVPPLAPPHVPGARGQQQLCGVNREMGSLCLLSP